MEPVKPEEAVEVPYFHGAKGKESVLNSEPTTLPQHIKDNPFFYDLPKSHRWFMGISLTIMSCCIGPVFMNWDPMAVMFSRAGAYSSLCHPDDESYKLLANGEIQCKDKEIAISAILGPGISAMFCTDLFAGIILDCFGGKIVTVLGLTFVIFGWLLIAFSSASFNGFFAGVILTAIGADPAFFGLLSVANLFPGWSSTMMGILGAGRSIGWGIGMVMVAIWDQYDFIELRGLSLGFICVLGFWLVFTIIFIPLQTYPKLPPDCKLNTSVKEGKLSTKKHLRRRPKIDLQLFFSEAKLQVNGFLENAITLPYILFCIVPIFTFVRNNYFGMTYLYHLPDVISFYNLMGPLSFLPCPFLGILADKVSASLTITLLASCGCISMFLVLFKGLAFQYIAVIFNFVFISFVSSQFYCYIGFNYPQKVMGKLVGVCVLIGGLSALIANPLAEAAKRNENLLMPIDIPMIILELVVIGITIFLHFKLELPARRNAALSEVDEVGKMKPV